MAQKLAEETCGSPLLTDEKEYAKQRIQQIGNDFDSETPHGGGEFRNGLADIHNRISPRGQC
jgi:hypothetical protein